MAPARAPWSLLVWIGVACVLFLVAPDPPERPGTTPEEAQAQQRATDFVVRDTKQWQATRGDLTVPWDAATGHLAIVIDDVGRELHLLEQLHALRFSLTFAVLPGSSYAAGVQLRLREDRRRYREVLLQLPMQTFLLATDDADALRRKLEAAFVEVPAAVGVDIHMDSRLATDREAMDVVVQSARARGLFVLDAGHDLDARDLEAREVVLDREVDEAAIEQQLQRAAELGRDHPVVAIGHPSAPLHAVLKRRLPELHAEGIGVYPVSHLLDR